MSIVNTVTGFLFGFLPNGISDLLGFVVLSFVGFSVFSVIVVIVQFLRDIKELLLW